MQHAPSPSLIRRMAPGGATLPALRRAVAEAAPEENVVMVREGVRFPPVCPGCGAAPQRTMRVERAFSIYYPTDDDTPNSTIHAVDAFDVPFCEGCIQRIQTEQHPPKSSVIVRRIFAEAEGFAGLVVIGIGFMFVPYLSHGFVPILLASFTWLTGFLLIRGPWKRSRYLTVPKPTGVDLAVDFTPVLSYTHESGWRAFQFRAAPYAGLFRELNAELLWEPKGSEARAARAQRRSEATRSNIIVGTIVVLVLLWALWDEYLRDLILPYLR